jgi:thiamine-phosphate pyrophosphorylase
MAMALRGFYAILDATFDATFDATSDALEAAAGGADAGALETRARQLLAAAPCFFQLRAKGATARAMAAASRRLLVLCREAGVRFCVNDRLDVALAVGADAVHLGQEDMPLADAQRVRALAGRPDLLIGFSTHNRAQALAAAEAGADYLGFGPVFGTATKLNPDPTVGLAALTEVCSLVKLPVVGIGGITLENVASVARAGAAAAAPIAAVSTASDPMAAAREIAASFR